MGKTRPLPLTAWPVQRAAAPREDATVHLGALDIVPADAFEARLAEVDGATFGGARVRGGRIVSPPSPARRRPAPPVPPARPMAPDLDTALPPVAPARMAVPTASDLFDVASWGRPLPLGRPDDDAVVTSFRTGPLARLLALLRRLLRR